MKPTTLRKGLKIRPKVAPSLTGKVASINHGEGTVRISLDDPEAAPPTHETPLPIDEVAENWETV